MLGRDSSGTIVFNRPEGELPTVRTNVGKLSPVTATADGRLTATFVPPQEAYPQVAILAVTGADGSLLDWTAIPLHGKAAVETETEPEARVTVQVADQEYGPIRADEKGHATLKVLVPPGVSAGTTTGADALGNTKRAALRLDAPAFPRLLGICSNTGDRMTALVVEPSGRRARNAQFELGAAERSSSPPVMTGPGVFATRVAEPPNFAPGQRSTYGLSLRNEPISTASCTTILCKSLSKSLMAIMPDWFASI